MESKSPQVLVSRSGIPEHDLALEERLIYQAAGGQISFVSYSWPRPTLVLGYGQNPDDPIWAVAKARSIPVLRRHTGGTGVLQHRDLNISLVLPQDHPWSRGIGPLYSKFAHSIARALGENGLKTSLSRIPVKSAAKRSHICFEDHAIETLLYKGKKVLGCAQGRRRGGVLVHGTLITGPFDPKLQADVFQVTEERISAAIGSLSTTEKQFKSLTDAIVRCICDDLKQEAGQ